MYLEISKIDLEKEENTNKDLIKSAQKNNDFKIYVASGSKDYMAAQTKHQVESLLKNKAFNKDNLSYHETKGNKHSYKQSYYYIIDGLKSFGF